MPRNVAFQLAPTNRPQSAFLAQYSPEDLAQKIASYDPSHWRNADQSLPGVQIQDRFSKLPEALAAAGADFTVAKCPIMGVVSVDHAIEVPRKAAIYRTDNHAALGVAGENYGLVQNVQAFESAGVLAERGEFDIRSIQVIDGGARVRLFGSIGASAIQIPGYSADVLLHYATFEAAHDGIHASLGALETVRVTCLNGNTARSRTNSFRVRHTSRAADRMKEAQATLLTLTKAAEAEVEEFQWMAERPMSLAEYRTFARKLLDEVLGDIENDLEVGSVKKSNRLTDLRELEELFLHGQGNHGVSRYDGYNSVTEWVSARREATRGSLEFAKRYESATTGYNAKYKSVARRMLTR